MYPRHQGVAAEGRGGEVLGCPLRPLPLTLSKLLFFISGDKVSAKSINLSIKKNVTLNKTQRESRHDSSVGNLGVT